MKCPKCGKQAGYSKSKRVSGIAKILYDGTGKMVDTDLSGVVFHEPKTVTCEKCGQRIPFYKKPKIRKTKA